MKTCVPFNKYFYVIGLLGFTFYAVLHMQRGNLIIATTSTINVVAIMTMFILEYKNKLTTSHKNIIIFDEFLYREFASCTVFSTNSHSSKLFKFKTSDCGGSRLTFYERF